MVTELKPDVEKRVVELYKKEKKSIFKISVEVGLSERQVTKIIEPHRRIQTINDVPDKRIIELRESGMTYEEMAAELGFSSAAVGRRLRGLGYQTKQLNEAKRPAQHVLHRLYVMRRLSMEDIGKRYRVSRRAVENWLAHYGITRDHAPVTMTEKIAMYKRYFQINEGRGRPSFEELYTFYVTRDWSAADMAVGYGVSEKRIASWLTAYDLKKWTQEDVKDTFGYAMLRFIPGVTKEEYANMIGVHPTTLRNYFVEVEKELIKRGEFSYDKYSVE